MLLEIILIAISISLFLFASFLNFFVSKARNENLDIEIENIEKHLKEKVYSNEDIYEVIKEIKN